MLATVVLAGCGGSASGPPPVPQRSGPELESIFEDESLLQANPVAALKTFLELGANRVRVFVAWNTIAPPTATRDFNAGNPASYPASVWARYDAIIRDAAAEGISVDLTVGALPPQWAAGRGMPRDCGATSNGPCVQWKPSAAEFGQFIHALGVRYSGHYVPGPGAKRLPRVSFWSIWNEPNYGVYLQPQTIDNSSIEISPSLYRGLVDAAWSALLRTGHTPANDTILIGETAPYGQALPPKYPGIGAGMFPLRFVRALYCLASNLKPLRGAAAIERGCPATAAASASFAAQNPALFDASGFAVHPYSDSVPPNDPSGSPPDSADFPSLGRLERTLDRAAAVYGRHDQLPIYSTEFGEKTGSKFLDPATGAIYMNETEYLSWINPRIRSYDQYTLVDPPAADSHFDTGLEYANGQPKPMFYAYRMPLWLPKTTAAKSTALQVWGCVRPAPYEERLTHHPQTVSIQFAPDGTKTFRTIQRIALTDPRAYFDVRVKFAGSGDVRLAWHGFGTEMFSRIQPITLH
jgi:hypothetical protein